MKCNAPLFHTSEADWLAVDGVLATFACACIFPRCVVWLDVIITLDVLMIGLANCAVLVVEVGIPLLPDAVKIGLLDVTSWSEATR